MPGKVKENSSD